MIRIKNKDYTHIKGILLDKDGTLIDIEALHLPLMKRRAKVIANLCKVVNYKEILKSWGIDLDANRIDIRGPFMAASKQEEKVVATTALYRNGMDWREAYLLVENAYEIDELTDNDPQWNKAKSNVQKFVQEASERGYVLGIATGDTTLRAVEACKVLGFHNKMKEVLGVDQVKNDKPAPDLILEFCKRTGLKPDEVMTVGDSIKDILMAKKANVGLNIAVLSGVTLKEEFAQLSDHIISDFKEIKFI